MNPERTTDLNKKQNKTKKRGCGCLVFTAVLVITIIYALSDDLAVRKYTVESSLVTEDRTFVVISDLHSTYYGEKQEELVETIDRYAPDAVLLLGDIADDKEERQAGGAEVLLAQIGYRYPCYYVTGNHECWLDYTEDIHELIGEYGVKVLTGDSADLGGGIVLHGLDDPLFFGGWEGFTEELGKIGTSEEKFDILLSHRPEYIDNYLGVGMDLTFAGHAHGGQVRIPLFLNGLYAPNQGWFPKYAGGRYDFDDSTMIVSRGLMIDDLPRVFNRPEVLVVEVRGEK